MRKLIKVFTALLFNAIMGALIALLLGYNPFWGAAVASLVAIAAGTFMPKGSAYAGVLKEVWTGRAYQGSTCLPGCFLACRRARPEFYRG